MLFTDIKIEVVLGMTVIFFLQQRLDIERRTAITLQRQIQKVNKHLEERRSGRISRGAKFFHKFFKW